MSDEEKKDDDAKQDSAEENIVQEAAGDDWGDALAEQAASKEETDAKTEDTAESVETAVSAEADEKADVASVEFDNLINEGAPASQEHPDLDMILDIHVVVSLELGRTEISIRELLQLTQGSVVELERVAGEPLDVKINGKLIAQGEVVVVNDNFGIRLTEVVNATDRIKQLNAESS